MLVGYGCLGKEFNSRLERGSFNLKILHRYLVVSFFKVFVVTLMGAVSVFLSVDFFEKIDDLLEVKVPVALAAKYFILKFPFMISQVFAPSVLLSVLFCYAIFHHRREIIAMKSAGLSYLEYTIPLIIAVSIVSLLFFFFREYVERPFTGKSEQLWSSKISHSHKKTAKWKESGIWYATKNAIFHLRYYDPQNKVFYKVSIFILKDDFELLKQINADSMRWAQGKWRLTNVKLFSFNGNTVTFRKEKSMVLDLREAPENFIAIRSLPETLSLNRLLKIIFMMKKEGISSRPYILELNVRFAEFIMVFVAGLIGTLAANHSLVAPSVIKIIISGGLLYTLCFGMLQIGIALASAGYVSPYVGIWAPPLAVTIFLGWQKNKLV